MVDLKVSGMTEDTSPTKDDLVTTVQDPGGTPLNRKATIENFFKVINNFNSVTDLNNDAADLLVVYQASDNTIKKIITDNFFKGIQDVYIPSSAMWPRSTNGCAALAKTELSTNKINIQTLDFDASSIEYAQCIWKLPRQYDGSTITFVPDWTAASGSGDVIWQVSARAYANDDALDQAQGTAQTSTDTLITANDQHEGPASSAITIAGSPAGGQLIIIEISRKASDGGDTLSVDAKLLGITLRIGVNKKASA